MNAKIKELAEQASVLKYKVWEVGAITVTNAEDLERFAELIVRECAKKCEEFGDRLEDERPNTDLGVIAYECADGIKRMFGVEE